MCTSCVVIIRQQCANDSEISNPEFCTQNFDFQICNSNDMLYMFIWMGHWHFKFSISKSNSFLSSNLLLLLCLWEAGSWSTSHRNLKSLLTPPFLSASTSCYPSTVINYYIASLLLSPPLSFLFSLRHLFLSNSPERKRDDKTLKS